MSSDKKRIAKNTVALYFRMLLVMAVGIYTGRVVLDILGIDNYGIYNTVAGITGFLGFITIAMSTGTSRFITYGLGKGDLKELENTFSTCLNIHILLALLIALILEPVGLYMIYNKLQIPAESLSQAVVAFHWAILSAMLSIIMCPFNATIIAHEKMGAFAFMSIFDVTAKLVILYLLLMVSPYERLAFYSFFGVCVSIATSSIYIIYCLRKFKEIKWHFTIDKKVFKEISTFSGWSMFSATAWTLNTQGIIVMLNMFFSPAVVASRAVSLTVSGSAIAFIGNFRTAVNPQIIKLYASGDEDGSKAMLLSTTKYIYFMTLFLVLPVVLLASPVLELWLVEVPPYAVPFLQLVMLQSLFQLFDNSFYTALYAHGDLKLNALLSPTCLFVCFPAVYIAFKLGASPLALSWCMIVTCAILGFVVKPYLLVKQLGYKYSEIWRIIGNCAVVTMFAVPLPLAYRIFSPENWTHYIICGLICVLSVMISVWTLGLESDMRKSIIMRCKRRLRSCASC